jgi:hypothetical protein
MIVPPMPSVTADSACAAVAIAQNATAHAATLIVCIPLSIFLFLAQ